MIKILLVSTILFFCATWSKAQLTNGEVYDYEIGDVHQVKGVNINGGSASSTIRTDTIIFKSYSAGLDSITYYIKRHDYSSPVVMGGPNLIAEYVDTFTIVDLNQLAFHFSPTSCLPPTDTSFTDTCGVYYERLSSNFDTSCFEPNIWYSDLHSGLGGPYHYESNTVGGYTTNWKLIYHNTTQNGECGTPIVVVGINEKHLTRLKLYPNPSNGEFLIEIPDFNGERYSVSIVDVSGVELQTFKIDTKSKTMDLKKYSAGIYFVQLTLKGNIVSIERIVLN